MNLPLRRTDIEDLAELGLRFDATWQVVDHFEKLVANFFGAPPGVAVDSCTHGLELCLRLLAPQQLIEVPAHTYLSVPMTLDKLNIPYRLIDLHWSEHYQLRPLPIIDAATQWRRNSYAAGTYTVVSFQFQKHLPIGRGGMILLDDQDHWRQLQCMVRDGRERTLCHDDDNVKMLGFHYHMTPEDAARGIRLFHALQDCPAKTRDWSTYTDLRKKDFFSDR